MGTSSNLFTPPRPDLQWDIRDSGVAGRGGGGLNTSGGTPCPHITCSHLTTQVIYLLFSPVVCLCGVGLNALSLLVFSRPQFGRMASIMRTYMMVIASSNIIYCLLTLPVSLIRCVPPHDDDFKLMVVTTTIVPLSNVAANTSTFLTVGVAIERSLYMRKFFKKHHVSTIKKHSNCQRFGSILFVILFVWVVNLPPLLSFTYSGRSCYMSPFGESFFYRKVYPWMKLFLIGMFPLITMCILDVLLIRNFRRMRSFLNSSGSGQPPGQEDLGADVSTSGNSFKEDSRQQAPTRQESSYIGLLLCSCILYTCCQLLWPFLQLIGYSAAKSSLAFTTLVVVSNCLVTVSYAADFLLFYIFNKQFRSVARRTLACPRRRGRSNSVAHSSQNRIIVQCSVEYDDSGNI